MQKPLGALLALALACGGSNTGPSGNGIGTFTATIDGAAWASDAPTLQVSSSATIPGTLVISGTKVISATNYTSLALFLGYIAGPGTYPLGVNQGTTAGGGGSVTSQASGVLGIWSSGFSGAAGTVTITSLTSTRMTGTFQFTALPQSGSQASGNRVVTNGSFDVPLGAGFTLPPANNLGSKISATIAGSPWNGATVVALGTGGAFAGGGTSDSYHVSLTTSTVVAAGNSYPIGNSGVSVSVILGNASWGGTGSTGTVTISSLGNGRVAGLFAGTLPRLGGGAPLVIANGSFDMRVNTP